VKSSLCKLCSARWARRPLRIADVSELSESCALNHYCLPYIILSLRLVRVLSAVCCLLKQGWQNQATSASDPSSVLQQDFMLGLVHRPASGMPAGMGATYTDKGNTVKPYPALAHPDSYPKQFQLSEGQLEDHVLGARHGP
jgi:hypothetical protein